MADVLLVHVREDETLADNIGISLERSGLTVARGESVFDVGDEVPCVVVLWSDISTRSSMVRDVAIRAQREGKLVAATLGGCETPLGFARPSPYDLSEWGGDPDDPILDAVFFAADRLVCAAKLNTPAPRARPQMPYIARPASQRPVTQQRAPRDLPEEPLPVQPIYERAPRAQEAPPQADSPGNLPPNLAAETLAWKQIENSKDPQDFLDYLGHYGPKGLFSELASMKLDKLTAKPKPQAKASFMPHNPAPHVEKRAPQQRMEPQRRPEPAPRVEALRAPPMRAEPAPMPPRAEGPRGERLSEVSRPAEAPRAGGGRVRVATAARRRSAAAPARVAIHEENRGGFPWGVLVVVAILGAGGLALYQNLPKAKTADNSAPAGVEEALRAAPMDDLMTPDDDSAAPEATSLADATAPVKRELGKKAPAKLADAAPARPPVGVGGPVVSMTPRRDAAAPRPATASAPPATAAEPVTTPPPVVAFHPITPATSAPTTAAPAPRPAAAFDPTTPAAPRYVQPQWIKEPSGSSLASYYPQEALDSNVPGKASLDCAILMSGRLNCVVAAESPANMGFGAAAVKASRGYIASPQAQDGSMAYGQRTRLTISFR
jgi:protein TonB